MKCPFQNFDCINVNTSGMTQEIDCVDCEHYDDGVQLTGGCLPIISMAIIILLICIF